MGASGNQPAPAATRSRRSRRWRRLGFVLVVLTSLEAAGWLGDYVLDFRRQLLWRLRLTQIESQPAKPDDGPGDATALWIRDEGEGPAPEEPYRAGETVIRDAGPWVRHRRLTPDDCPGTPGRRTFVLGGSAAFGYPYRFGQSFAALADRQSAGEDHRVLNAAHVGATSSDMVPVARTILDHYAPATLVVFAGNNEWFHWRPRRQGTSGAPPPSGPLTEPSRALLRSLACSRAVSAVELILLDLLPGHRQPAAPIPVTRDDGFVEHHSLVGVDHAVENPLTPERFDISGWPATRQRYLDRFEANLETIVEAAGSRDVRVILLTMPFRYRLSPAWKQRQPACFAQEHRAELGRLIDEALGLQEQQEATEALQRVRRAIALDPLPAVPHYLEAQLLETLDRPAEAETAYARGREAMIGNLGGSLSINRVIRRVADKHGAGLVDVRRIFDDYEHERGRYFNVDLVHDDCHPTPLGHRLIARALQDLLATPSVGSGEGRLQSPDKRPGN